MFCVTARTWGDYVLCYCTYLRRICSVLLHVSEETMFCVTARISKHMYDQFTIQTSLIQVYKIHFLITYISYKCLILAYIINNHNLTKVRSTSPSIWQEPLEVKFRWTFFYDYILKRSTNQKALPGFSFPNHEFIWTSLIELYQMLIFILYNIRIMIKWF